jgi:hypothetical protein
MKIFKNMKIWLSAVMILALGVTSCIEEGTDAVSGKGINEFRFSGGDFGIVTFKPFLADQNAALITIYRDAVSTAAIDEEVTITFDIDPADLTAYNTANATTFLPTNPAWYTLNIPEGTLTFAPFEGAKTIRITLNTNPFDLSLKYAIPLRISNPSGGFVLNEAHDVIIVQTLPINKYDGVYEVTKGAMSDVSAAGAPLVHSNTGLALLTTPELQTYGLVTTGASSCAIWDYSVVGNFASPIYSTASAGFSQFGAFSVEFTFNGSDKIITAVNKAGQPAASNGRYASIDPTTANQWSAAGIDGCGYRRHQPSVMGGAYNASAPPDFGSPPRATWLETWKYLEPR